MGGGVAARFGLEVVFLALLALAAGLADLSTGWIVGVMVAGWLLVTLIEWLAWRSEVAEAAITRGSEEAEDETTDWDIGEILAPSPEPEGSTSVLAGGEGAADEPPRRRFLRLR
jgi:hypothetical protein